MKYIIISILIFLTADIFAQEMVVPATYNVELLNSKTRSYATGTMKSDVLIELPFVDDFSRDYFPGNEEGYAPLWLTRNATRNTSWAVNPPTVGVVSLDGGDETGYPYQWALGAGPADTLTSCPINLTGTAADNIGISFYFQPHGLAVQTLSPTTDSLILEFYAPDLDQWFWAWSTIDLSDSQNFTFVYIPITSSNFLMEGFQFRFRNIAELQGSLDPWHIDYVWVDRNALNSTPVVDDVAFVRSEFTLLQNYTVMPLTHYENNPATHMRQDITLKLRNLNTVNRTLEGNKVRVLHEGVEVASFQNTNDPQIPQLSVLDYTQPIAQAPNNLVLDPGLGTDDLIYDVEISHAVSDFGFTTGNDTLKFQQRFETHYAYDDGSAEAGYAVFGNGQREALMRYTSTINDSIWALQIFTMPRNYDYENTPMTIRIYAAGENGPGALIAEKLTTVQYGQDFYQQSIIYTFDDPVFVPAGPFFVGYRESNQANSLVIGLDRNTNSNPGRLFWRVGSTWNSSSVQGSVMIRPMFGSNLLVSAPANEFGESLTLYPNPATREVSISFRENVQLQVRIFDLGGRLVRSEPVFPQQKIELSELAKGMYLFQISDPSGNVATKKLVVNR